jgi:hypothetical protein
MAPAEFDRIWFLRMRSLPRLSLSDCDDEEDEDDTRGVFCAAGERDRLLPPLPASLGRSLRPAAATSAPSSPPSAPPPASQRKSLAAAPAAVVSAETEQIQGSVEIGGGNSTDAAAQKKSRWRNKAGVLCTIL